MAIYDFARINFMNFSEDLANASWSKAGAAIDASSPLLVGYEGQSVSLSTYTSTNSNQSGNGLISTSTTGGLTVSAGQLVYASVFTAPITGPSTGIVISSGPTQLFVTFNFATKTFTTIAGVPASTRFEELPGGVFRLIVGWVATSALNLKTHAGYVNGALAIRLGGISLALNERYEKQTDGQTLLDRSGNNNNGILGATAGAEGTDPTWVAQGLQFDGVDDIAATGAFTVPSGDFTFIQIFTPLVDSGAADGRSLTRTDNSAGRWRMSSYLGPVSGSVMGYKCGIYHVTGGFSNTGFTYLNIGQVFVNQAAAAIVRVQGTSANAQIRSLSNTQAQTAALGAAPVGGTFAGFGNTANALHHGFYVWPRRLSDTELTQAYRAIKRTLAARGVVLP